MRVHLQPGADVLVGSLSLATNRVLQLGREAARQLPGRQARLDDVAVAADAHAREGARPRAVRRPARAAAARGERDSESDSESDHPPGPEHRRIEWEGRSERAARGAVCDDGRRVIFFANAGARARGRERTELCPQHRRMVPSSEARLRHGSRCPDAKARSSSPWVIRLAEVSSACSRNALAAATTISLRCAAQLLDFAASGRAATKFCCRRDGAPSAMRWHS